MSGRTERIVLEGMLMAGTHEIELDATSIPSGAYFCRLSFGDETVTARLVVK